MFLSRISDAWEGYVYVSIWVYPLFIFLLPFQTPKNALLLMSFGLGLALDVLMESPGLHAFASVLTAFIRPYVLSLVEPSGGYSTTKIPSISHYGWRWFLRYASILLAIHLFVYFLLDVFLFARFFEVLYKTVCSYVLSITFVFIIMLIFNPKR